MANIEKIQETALDEFADQIRRTHRIEDTLEDILSSVKSFPLK